MSAGQSIGNAAEKIANISDGYSAANAGFAGLKAYDAIADLQAIKEGKGNIASASIGIGFEYSKSRENAESSTPVVTGIRGGQSVTIEATSGDINSHGAQIIAGYDQYGLPTISDSDKAGDITLKAGNDINLQSAQATSNSSSSSSSMGASIGVSAGLTLNGIGVGISGSAHAGTGKSNSESTTQVNSHVTGTGDLTLESGRDTNLKGAVVSGETVTADVGRDLNIISVPDTGSSSNSSASIGASFSGPLGGMPSLTGVSPGGGLGSGKTNWISEQSGLVSSGQMDVTVGGNTHLGAGKIISESGDLTLDTGTLTFENFQGSKQYEGFDVTLNIDLTGKGPQQPGETSQPRTTGEGSWQLDDTRQEVRATVGPGEIIIRDEEKQAALEAGGATAPLEDLNRDPDKAYEITKDKHVGIEFYLSDTSLKAAADGIEVIGKTLAQAFDAMASKLSASGSLSPEELQTARKVAKALDNGTLDLQGLIACTGRQGFNLLDWIITPAYASSGCALFDTNGKLIADLTPQEREACVQMLASLMEKYANDYLPAGSETLPGSVRTIAEQLRRIGSDEQLVAGAQALGMSASFIRDLTVRLTLGEEKYKEFKAALAPLADAGEFTKEAAERAIVKLAAERGLSEQDIRDLKLVTGVTTAVIVAGIGAKTGVRGTPELGRKLDYFLGLATGSRHNIERSRQMLGQMERIGLPDTPATRQYLVEHLSEVVNNNKNIVGTQPNGRVVRESLLVGPQGAVKLETIWEGNRLITGNIFGGR